MSTDPLPTYDRPPVVETVLSAQFEPIQGLGVAQLGAFCVSLGPDWPQVDMAMPLPPVKEKFGDDIEWDIPQLRVSVVEEHSLRFMVSNADKTRLIQVQNGRLVLNWTGTSGGEYPRYEVLRNEFSALLDQLSQFLRKINLLAPKFDQWEVTYVNHVPRMGLWNTARDATFFSPLQSLPSRIEDCELEDVKSAFAFVLPESRGRLHVSFRRAKDQSAREVFVLEFTTRGPLLEGEQPQTERLLEGIDLGRETIVRSFRDMVSVEANQYWGLHDGCVV